MITPAFVQMMARYNGWQNHNLFGAAAGLDEAARKAERGAFFGSIHGTLAHLLWGDSMWMHRFAGLPKPEADITDSPFCCPQWADLLARRKALDAAIATWADSVTQQKLDATLDWVSASQNTRMSRPIAGLIVHFFNHQTHHRGQVHAMLTAAGAKPGPTDLAFMPEQHDM